MNYSEASYFADKTGRRAYFQHIADYLEHLRLVRVTPKGLR